MVAGRRRRRCRARPCRATRRIEEIAASADCARSNPVIITEEAGTRSRGGGCAGRARRDARRAGVRGLAAVLRQFPAQPPALRRRRRTTTCRELLEGRRRGAARRVGAALASAAQHHATRKCSCSARTRCIRACRSGAFAPTWSRAGDVAPSLAAAIACATSVRRKRLEARHARAPRTRCAASPGGAAHRHALGRRRS